MRSIVETRLKAIDNEKPPARGKGGGSITEGAKGMKRQPLGNITGTMRQGAHAVNVKLEAALAYSRMRWRIFPCHSIVQTDSGPACSCGKGDCGSPGKHPRNARGFKDATDDVAQIKRWWSKWCDANIALATGSGIAVFDIDGQEGFDEFKTLVAANSPVPDTLVASTGRGFHLVFATRPGAGQVRNSARGNVHVRGEGGYIIVAPSNHISGRNYQWVKKGPVGALPEWLRQWSQGYEIANKNTIEPFDGLGQLPAHLQSKNTKNISAQALESLKTVWSPSEQARLTSALSSIPSNSYEIWFQIGMALKTLDWERSDGSSIAFELFDSWSQTTPDKYAQTACEDKWRSFGRRPGITLGTVYHLAQQHGWAGGAPAPQGASSSSPKPEGMNGHANGATALPAAFLAAPSAIFWPDRDEEGRPKSTCTNAGVAVRALAIGCKKDLFHEKFLVAGEPIHAWAGDMSDDVIQMIRKTIRYKFGFDPKVENTRDACTQLCLENQFDPVCDYLDSVQWDGTARLETWLIRYMGAPDTELNRAIGRLTLIAAVRRAFAPGTKFDQIVVLEGTEGRGKSSAIEILAGKENFSDQKILGLSDKEQQEAMCGVWLYEIAELTGMRRAETEHVKAFASRTVDRARPAYGRFRVDRPRRAICFATTNDDEYLKSETGNRRFWPVVTGHIELEALRRDRDQLWAEAAELEAKGVSISLPEHLWKVAGDEQLHRKEVDPWRDLIKNYLRQKKPEDVSVMEVLVDNQFLQLRPSEVGQREQNRAASVLRGLGFIRFQKRTPDGDRIWRYRAI